MIENRRPLSARVAAFCVVADIREEIVKHTLLV